MNVETRIKNLPNCLSDYIFSYLPKYEIIYNRGHIFIIQSLYLKQKSRYSIIYCDVDDPPYVEIFNISFNYKNKSTPTIIDCKKYKDPYIINILPYNVRHIYCKSINQKNYMYNSLYIKPHSHFSNYRCPLCYNIPFYYKINCNTSDMTVDYDLYCFDCEKSILYLYFKIEKIKMVNHECHKCGYTTQYKGNLNNHMKRKTPCDKPKKFAPNC